MKKFKIIQHAPGQPVLRGKKFLLVHLGGAMKLHIIKTILEQEVDLYLAQETFPDYLEGYISRDAFIAADPYNLQDLLSKVTRFMQYHQISFDGIGTYFEHAVPNTAILAQMLGVVGIEPGIAYRSSNFKPAMRELCRLSGIRSPKFIFLGQLTREKLNRAITDLGGAIVIKPIFGDDSNGVIKIDEHSDQDKVFEFIQGSCTMKQEMAFKYFTREFMAESYVEGIQVSVDGIVQDRHYHVAGIVETVISNPPYHTAFANYFPPRVNVETYNEARQYCLQVLRALGFDNCGFHCELKLTLAGPVLIEISCRPPGGKIMEGYERAYGIDFVTAMLHLWLGYQVNLSAINERYIYQAGVFSEQGGTLGSIEGISKASAGTGVKEMIVVTKVGEKVITYPDIPIPIYYFSVEASSLDVLEKQARYVKDQVHFKII